MPTKDEIAALISQEWYDDGLKALGCHATSPKELLLFIYAFQAMCPKRKAAHGMEAKMLRSNAWQILDNNGNGLVSLAETGKFVQDHLKNFYTSGDNKHLGVPVDEAGALYKRYYPCFIRAFNDAADYGPATKLKLQHEYSNTKTTGDDYVEFKEFRLLLTYLCIYASIFEAFGTCDGNGKGFDATDDRRISQDEWATHCKALCGHPLLSLSMSANADPAAVFGAMDSDGKGKVLLGEFSKYIEDYEFSLCTRWGKLLNAGEPVVASAGAAASNS